MIIKFNDLQKVGVFDNFLWDDCVKNKNGEVVFFDKLNILYGQNYAGKTTLSRIMRSLEIGKFSEKYTDAKFFIKCSDDRNFTHKNLGNNPYNVRVFNEDFIRDNIEFNNPEKAITPFALLGAKNKEIDAEIERLKNFLGDERLVTGLFADRADYISRSRIYEDELKNIEKSLQKSLSEKATGKEIGIKYKKKYDKINYDIKALRFDIKKVINRDFGILEKEQIINSELILSENTKDHIKEITKPKLNFNSLQESVSRVVTKVVGKSDKIDALVKNAVLNRWVKEGKELHSPETKCGLCNGVLSFDRWEELDRHFDEESESLEREIFHLLNETDSEERKIKEVQLYKEDFFYSKFREELHKIQDLIGRLAKEYVNSLNLFREKLRSRQKAILEAADYNYISDVSVNLESAYTDLEYLRHESNHYTSSLNADKKTAIESLRLQEIYEYLKEIRYNETITRINYLKQILFDIEQNIASVDIEINKTTLAISDNIKLITDESKGAEKINEYLEHHFGHQDLRLEPIYIADFFDDDKLAFEVQRDGKKAYHLSEGEKSLIAFCYFVAKLEDVETKGLKPVVWIDDPISSLDSNHIFFIYSLIKSHIYDKKDFLQLFISTHNLNFLKYLKRLPTKKDKDSDSIKYFLVERIDKTSSLREMPRYLQEHVTEFNYLFKSVYDCANITIVDDSNYTLFYNFGNNARKFLEIYLYYKYPNFENDESKYKKFFGTDSIPAILTNRLINEYSHLCGVIERGETPIEIPEMKKTAEMICKKMQEKDKDQFDALVKSML
ncbi:Wobble nucleotide-excising tRNase [Chryseobacterium piscicola]|uniref:Wobble nucleotide-excising tRNase n=1 Tax=Chryseobacterium piscicola TaxID=551459 RepID=A0A1N7NNK6_9FLAO|nr:AAA family ATPase [Chryseobacterium piscicola]PQA90391.1 hypothetical protein B0A70_13700 [Chryseobacterium piscicola]SIS99926.1 Wobble nucleotide-excising tRNase [Chryseobacterium piscicola]